MLEASIAPPPAPAPTKRMELIDEQYDLPVRFRNLLEHRLQAVLKFAAELCPGYQSGQVKGDQFLRLQHVRNITGNDPLSQAFNNRGLANASSPIRTGLFLVLRARICITRRISSSRPITGSSFDLLASSVRSRAYFSSEA